MKSIRLTLTLLLVTFIFTSKTNAQNLDSLQNQVMKLMKYYESYDDGSPDSLKKAKYKAAVKDITDGTATLHEIEESFKIVDWYIKGDKALEQNKEGSGEDDSVFDELIENSEEAQQAIKIMEQQVNMFRNMSYSDFEATMRKANPAANTSEIKQFYNQMHKNDGKQVSISEADNKLTSEQQQLQAIQVLNNPTNYDEFSKAVKVLKPDVSETEIRKTWNKYGIK